MPFVHLCSRLRFALCFEIWTLSVLLYTNIRVFHRFGMSVLRIDHARFSNKIFSKLFIIEIWPVWFEFC